MNIHIREAKLEEYMKIEYIMRQVQKIHVDLRPDIYRNCEELLTLDAFEHALKEKTFFVADVEGEAAGIMSVEYRHIERPNQNVRNIIYIETIAVDEKYRRKGIGHILLDFAVKLKTEKDFDGVELQVNAKNSYAYEYYKHYGFADKSVNMELL